MVCLCATPHSKAPGAAFLARQRRWRVLTERGQYLCVLSELRHAWSTVVKKRALFLWIPGESLWAVQYGVNNLWCITLDGKRDRARATIQWGSFSVVDQASVLLVRVKSATPFALPACNKPMVKLPVSLWMAVLL